MRDLERNLVLSLGLIFGLTTACKTQRPVVDIEERSPIDATLMSTPDMDDGKAVLKVSALSLPLEAKAYTRVSILLQAKDMEDVTISNYMLKSEIPIRTNVKYALTVVAYWDGRPIYSNEYCDNSNRFTSRLGSNNYTVPVCPVPIEAGKLPTKDDGDMDEEDGEDSAEMIETPSAPGG